MIIVGSICKYSDLVLQLKIWKNKTWIVTKEWLTTFT